MLELALVEEVANVRHACLLQDLKTRGFKLVIQLNKSKNSDETFPTAVQMLFDIRMIRLRTAPDLNLAAKDLLLLDHSFSMPLSPKGTILRGKLRQLLQSEI